MVHALVPTTATVGILDHPVVQTKGGQSMARRVAIYTRVSKDPVGDERSPIRQEAACRVFAGVREWEPVGAFRDVDTSAYLPGVRRPEYEEMLTLIEAGGVEGVLVWKLDRLVRRPAEFERLWAACERAGVFVASVTEPIDSFTELGRAIVRILVTFASLESASKSLRLKAAEERLVGVMASICCCLAKGRPPPAEAGGRARYSFQPRRHHRRPPHAGQRSQCWW